MLDRIIAAAVGATLVVCAVVGGYAGWQALHAVSHWYVLQSVTIPDALFGQPVAVHVDREIRRPFLGQYTVTVLDVATGQTICTGGARTNYDPERALPPQVTLDWWTDGAEPPCEGALYPGEFRLTTCVEILHAVPLVGPRRSCAPSNIFRVVEG
jgi:hypothetical protein